MFLIPLIIIALFFGLSDQAFCQKGTSPHLIHAEKTPILWKGDIPEITFQAEPVGSFGWLLLVKVSNFVFAPKSVGRANIFTQGHVHLYIDGIKTTRLYSERYFLPKMKLGERNLRVTLSSNDHRDYHINGLVISSELTVFHGSSKPVDNSEKKELLKDPGLIVRVIRDPMHGWNLFVNAINFDFSNGWADLSINNKFNGRVYGGFYYLPDFLPERDSLKVTLKDEAGKVCLFDNVPIVEVIDQAHQMRWFASGLNSHPINRRNGLLKPEMGLAYDKQSIFINSNGMPTFQFEQRTPHTIEHQEHQ